MRGYHTRLIVDEHLKLWKLKFTCTNCGVVETSIKNPECDWTCGKCDSIMKIEKIKKVNKCRCETCRDYRKLSRKDKAEVDEDFRAVNNFETPAQKAVLTQ